MKEFDKRVYSDFARKVYGDLLVDRNLWEPQYSVISDDYITNESAIQAVRSKFRQWAPLYIS